MDSSFLYSRKIHPILWKEMKNYDYIHNLTDNRSYCRYVPITGHWCDRWCNVGGVWRLYHMRIADRINRQIFQENQEVSLVTGTPSFAFTSSVNGFA